MGHDFVLAGFIDIFLTAMWLPHSQLWVIIGRITSLTECFGDSQHGWVPKHSQLPSGST